MMEYTDRHFRMLIRLLSKKVVLYTEMLSVDAILHGKKSQHLEFSQQEHPLILQVGGNDIHKMAECTRIAADYGYDEININVGCPSDRVHKGSFGASLMARPEHVARLVEAMCATQTIAVSVKCRIGIDGSKIQLPTQTSYQALLHFADLVMQAGSTRLSVHARIAILGGLSPKENREIPPLQYDTVYRLAKERPDYHIEINGGISIDPKEIHTHLQHVDGVMIGRSAIHTPILCTIIDTIQNTTEYIQEISIEDRNTIAIQYAQYLEQAQAQDIYTKHAIRHIIPLYNGIKGAKRWRQSITMAMQKNIPPIQAVQEALKYSNNSAASN